MKNIKKLALLVLAIICLSSVVFATKDLVIDNFAMKDSIFEPKGTYHYILSIKNVGDETAETGLWTKIWFETQETPLYPNKLLQLYAEGRDFSNVKPIEIITTDGSKTTREAILGEVTYTLPAETPEQIKQRKEAFLSRGNEGMTEEEIQAELEKIEITYSQEYDLTSEELYIELQPGETAVYDSELTYKGFGALAFPAGKMLNDWPVLTTEEFPFTVNMELFLIDLNEGYNNKMVKEIFFQPNVKQGPLPASETNKKLKDATEYFSSTAGCGIINGKDICVKLLKDEVDDMDEQLVVSVDDQEEYYSMYNLFQAWLYKWFSDCKLAQSKTINGVKVTLYENGIKFKFNQ